MTFLEVVIHTHSHTHTNTHTHTHTHTHIRRLGGAAKCAGERHDVCGNIHMNLIIHLFDHNIGVGLICVILFHFPIYCRS
jgi:hypothetical protein